MIDQRGVSVRTSVHSSATDAHTDGVLVTTAYVTCRISRLSRIRRILSAHRVWTSSAIDRPTRTRSHHRWAVWLRSVWFWRRKN